MGHPLYVLGLVFPEEVQSRPAIWPEACTWMSQAVNFLARFHQKPNMLCPQKSCTVSARVGRCCLS